ncbi:hypothetical protein H9Y05_12910 [Crocinitomicaceae bacterium CZZ-1]|uniref:Uncharacterized protein n=1 Tax=Taishania pollutisoli TaxID=2766479 RepID=A0A8J6PK91_9FLAO|nr:hypothetical protein [Taishania pollutisoli]MBC9813371.1 hypothetical protein [Taishania pollutisoli]
MCLLKIYTLNFAAQSHRTASAFNFFFCPRTRERKFLFRGVRWHTKNANVPYRLFPHFSMLALTSLSIRSFALMQKNQKIKAKICCHALLAFLTALALRLLRPKSQFTPTLGPHFCRATARPNFNGNTIFYLT